MRLLRFGDAPAEAGDARGPGAGGCRGGQGLRRAKRRWVVKRTNAWLTLQRRLARDYERHEHPSETFIHIARTGLMLRRLA